MKWLLEGLKESLLGFLAATALILIVGFVVFNMFVLVLFIGQLIKGWFLPLWLNVIIFLYCIIMLAVAGHLKDLDF